MTWTAGSLGETVILTSVTYGADHWVAVGAGGLILTSPDARFWTPQASAVWTDTATLPTNASTRMWTNTASPSQPMFFRLRLGNP